MEEGSNVFVTHPNYIRKRSCEGRQMVSVRRRETPAEGLSEATKGAPHRICNCSLNGDQVLIIDGFLDGRKLLVTR